METKCHLASDIRLNCPRARIDYTPEKLNGGRGAVDDDIAEMICGVCREGSGGEQHGSDLALARVTLASMQPELERASSSLFSLSDKLTVIGMSR